MKKILIKIEAFFHKLNFCTYLVQFSKSSQCIFFNDFFIKHSVFLT
jgi:hypothetical protein